MKVYFDNMIVCGIERRDLLANQMEALDELMSGRYRNECKLVTSRWSLRDIERTRDLGLRERLKAAFGGITVLENDHRLCGIHSQADQLGGFVSSPLVSDITDQKVFDGLCRIGLIKSDPYHLMVALTNGCDRFVTTDSDFLDRRTDLHALLPSIKVVTPLEFVGELSTLLNGK